MAVSDDSPEARFGEQLRGLRLRAGLTVRQLADELHRAHSGIVEYERGRRLPSVDVVEQYEEYFGLRRGALVADRERARVERLEQPRDGTLPEHLGDAACPYKGLHPYEPEDAALYFGREDQVRGVVDALRRTRFVAVVGASGSGKSSFLRAGVIAGIRACVDGGEPADLLLLTPGERPLEALARVVGEPLSPDELRADPGALLAALGNGDRPAVVVVDQFEELFTLCRSEVDRRCFVDALMATWRDPSSPVSVLVAIRADFYGRVAAYPSLADAVVAHQALIGPLGAGDLRRTIELPAASSGLELQAGLVDTILGDLGDEPGVLPLLSHALLETFKRRRRLQLTVAGYQEAGGVSGAIAQTAERTLRALPGDDRAVARSIFLRLTEVSEGAEPTGRRVEREELVTRPQVGAHSDRVLDVLADARLVSVDASTVAVAHEALISHWPRLRGWIDADRAGLVTRRRLTQAAREWDALEREDAALYRGGRLVEAAEWAAEHPTEVSLLEQEFLDAGTEAERRERRAAADRARREQRNRLVRIAAIALGALAAGLVVAVLAAHDRSKLAQSRALAASATAQLPVDPELGLLLALEAVRRRDTAEGEQALRRAIVASRVRAVLGAGDPRPCAECDGLATTVGRGIGAVAGPLAIAADGRAVAGIVGGRVRLWWPQRGATARPRVDVGEALGVAFTADGARLLVVGLRRTALLSTAGAHEIELRDAGATGHAGATSPDGRRVVTAGPRGAAVWDARTGDRLGRLTDSSYVAAVFQDASRIALLDGSGYVVVWRWQAGRPPVALAPSDIGERMDALFAAGRRFAVDGIAGGRVRVVDLDGTARPLPTGTAEDPVTDVAMSADGSRVATVRESVVDLWRSREPWRGRAVRVGKLVHRDGVNAVVFSPDGSLVGTASTDGTTRVWDSATGDLVAELEGHGAGVQSVAFSTRGRYVVTLGEDLTVRLWDLGEGLTQREPRAVAAVAVAPSGSPIAVALEDGSLELRKLPRSQTPAGTLRPSGQRAGQHATSVAFAARKPVVVAGYTTADGLSGRLQLLRDDGGMLIDRAIGGGVTKVAVDSAARLAAVVRNDPDGGARVELWSLANRMSALPAWQVPIAGREVPSDAALSPDGRRLLVTSVYGLARLYDPATHRLVRILAPNSAARPGPEAFYRATFSPDGKTVAITGSRDVRLWDVASDDKGDKRLSGHTSVLRSVAYSADGRRVVTASADGTVRVWDPSRGVELSAMSRHAGRVNGAAFLPDGWVVSGGDDGTVRVYPCESCASAGDLRELARRRLTRRLTAAELARFGG